MSKFNVSKAVKSKPNAVNSAGGQAYQQSDKLELASLVLTSFAKDTFYKTTDEKFKRLNELIGKCPLFAAKALIFARNEYGMRSITHMGAAVLAKHAAGTQWGTKFFDKIIRRPDDMTEIASAYFSLNSGKMLSNAIKRGFKEAFNRFNEYSLAKYKMSSKEISLVDIVNLVHPVPTEINANALKLLVANKLVSTDTWESQLSETGKTAKNGTELLSLKAEVWTKLLAEKKLPYFALLRNLRNILTQAPEAIDMACTALKEESAIKKSLVLPFRFMTAFKELFPLAASNSKARVVLAAISEAIDKSLSNFPKFEGETLVVLDRSGSMDGQPTEIGSLFAASMAKAFNADVIRFGTGADYYAVSLKKDTIELAMAMSDKNYGGTNYHAWINTMNKAYDRIIVLSDGEAWEGWRAGEASMKQYRKKYSCDPHIFNFDLAGNGTMQFPEKKVYCLAGFSDKTLDLIKVLEEDKNALINKIEAIKL